jgi:alanine dehydrogenase
LLAGINVLRGELTHAAVAESLGITWRAAAEVARQ